MSLQYLAIKRTFTSLDENEKKILIKELFNENVIYTREILNKSLLIAFLVINDPENIYIKYHKPGSESYNTITSWCYDRGKLKQFKINNKLFHERILVTYNEILYDKENDNFIQENHKITHLKINSDLVPERLLFLPKVYTEKLFSEKHLQELEEIGAISRRIFVPKFLITE